MSIETLEDIVEGLANRLGIYGTCKGADEGGNIVRECLPPEVCRICFVSDLKGRILEAIEMQQIIDEAIIAKHNKYNS